MEKEELEFIKKYLVWRFNRHNVKKYRRYCNDWINGLHVDQIKYFKEEMKRLINKGEYQP